MEALAARLVVAQHRQVLLADEAGLAVMVVAAVEAAVVSIAQDQQLVVVETAVLA